MARKAAKKKAKKATTQRKSNGGYQYETLDVGYRVYKRGKLLGDIIPSREPTGRHCFYLALDTRKDPRTYRGKAKSAEALEAIHKLVSDAKSKKWKPEVLIINSWDYRPTASNQW